MLVCLETRADPKRLENTFKLLGFDNVQYSAIQGYAGRIVVAWKTGNIDIVVEKAHFQFIHLKIVPLEGEEWLFTPVYASPREDVRRHLWEELTHISRRMTERWMVAGDFNDIAYAHEKKGGTEGSQRKGSMFVKRINDCKLLDLGAVGPRFT